MDKVDKEDQRPIENPSPTKLKASLTVEDFIMKHKLGKGAYGDVFLVMKKSDKNVYALKQIQKKKLEKQQKQYQAMVQKELLTKMKHPGIVTLKYSFQDKINLYFVEEFCQGGEFINFMKENINKLTDEIKIFYVAQMVSLLEYLHTNGVTHRDLKPENLMLDRKGHLKLIDFGTAEITNCKILSNQFKENILKLKQKSEELQIEKEKADQEELQQMSALKKRRSTFVGTCYYISPELLEHNYCLPSADLWALGCIIYQLYYLETPFKDNYQFAVFEKIKKAEVTYTKNETITDEAIDLIKRLLIKNPDQRLGSGMTEELSYAKLKAHPYFKGLNIDNIYNLPVPTIPNLHEPEKSEQEKIEAKERYQEFKQRQKQLLESIVNQGKQIMKFEILEEKSFIFYNYALLVLCKTNELFLVGSDGSNVKKQLHFKQNAKNAIKLLTENILQIATEQRVYNLRSSSAQQWAKALLSQL